MVISLPELSLVVLIGTSGSGKSTFAHAHFKPTEIISSDYCRGLVADNENDQTATESAFEVLHYIAAKRLQNGRLTVIDATNVRPEDRKHLTTLAKEYHVLLVAIVLNLPEEICRVRNESRPDRNFGPHVIRAQKRELRRSLGRLKQEGFRQVYLLNMPEEVSAVSITRTPLWTNRKTEHGPFDVIGDVHGCCDELEILLARLGYEWQVSDDPVYSRLYIPPNGRKAIFLGDLVDRGPRVLHTVRLVQQMVAAGHALCVPGNHDMKLVRKLRGRDVQIKHGLAQTLAELAALSNEIRPKIERETAEFLDSLISHYVLDEGRLVVTHAGLPEKMHGRASAKVRDFCLYGETTGETDEFGLPVRYNWAADYRGQALVIYGHTPVPQANWLNGTLNIDTGCVFGGSLTALRYPEREFVSVPAARVYTEPARPPVTPVPLTTQQQHDDLLNITDVLGKRILSTRLRHQIIIREENSIAALEVMSRFAVNPKWLIYLPPTMSPTETTNRPDLLEHPAEAFAYYRREGVAEVICQEKHMGSRAVVVVCRDETAVLRRFGLAHEGVGVVYTRTGRRFFDNLAVETEFLQQIQAALTAANFWQEFETDWVCLDGELMPWSAKAQELLRQQYAAVGAAAQAALAEVAVEISKAAGSGVDMTELNGRFQPRIAMTQNYREVYGRYCWPVHSVNDLRLAPFHVLATEGAIHTDKTHRWHMETIATFVAHSPLLQATQYHITQLQDPASEVASTAWWEDLTARGGEGMVVKPMDFVTLGERGVIQPAVKCRGRDYLRLIYGPEYTTPENLERLRQRGVAGKRSLALREFALGVEALERFVQGEPLRRVHECVFGVLALESEPVDPRL